MAEGYELGSGKKIQRYIGSERMKKKHYYEISAYRKKLRKITRANSYNFVQTLRLKERSCRLAVSEIMLAHTQQRSRYTQISIRKNSLILRQGVYITTKELENNEFFGPESAYRMTISSTRVF